MRKQCLADFMQREGQLSIGFCACCSFTTTDFVFNALYWCQCHEIDDLDRNRAVGSTAEELSVLCKPRPRQATQHWFPTVSFGRTARDKQWDMQVASNKLKMSFAHVLGERKNSASMATICVQAMGFSNWPDGVKVTPYGPCSFSASAYSSHDIKRGALMDLAFSGVMRRSP